MDELTVIEHEEPVLEGELVLPDYGKVLSINALMQDVDLRGILNKVFQYVDMASVLQKIEKGAEYIVNIPTEFQAGFEAGKYWIMESSKTGKLWPSLMELGEDGRNHIVTPLPIKKRDVIQGNPAKEIADHYHNLYLQQQMVELSGLIESTLDTVKRIEHGQMDDRIALLNAGRQGVVLALAQKDEASRASAMLLAINNINVAQNQILETFKRRVNEFEALPKTAFGQFLREMIKSGYLDGKDIEYGEIQEYFGLYIQATRMLAGAYAAIGDEGNAQRVFDMSVAQISSIDFRKLRTIEYSHKGAEFTKIYASPAQYLLTEKQICLEAAKDYECLSISVNGEELLEVIANGNAGTVCS
jgi:hypothetical protein